MVKGCVGIIIFIKLHQLFQIMFGFQLGTDKNAPGKIAPPGNKMKVLLAKSLLELIQRLVYFSQMLMGKRFISLDII